MTLSSSKPIEPADRLFVQGLLPQQRCEEILEWLDSDPKRKAHILCNWELSNRLAHPRLFFHLLRGIEVQGILHSLAWESLFLQSTYLCMNEEGMFLEELRKIQEEIHAFASDFSDGGVRVAKNMCQTLSTLKQVYWGSDLDGHFDQIPALICGAGPSLERSYEFLRRCKGRVLLFAGGAALAALEKRGIEPDLAAVIDPYPALERLKLAHSLSCPLFFQGRGAPELIEFFKGPKIWIEPSGHFPLEEALAQEAGLPSQSFEGGWTTSTFLVALAHRLGCNPIGIVGVDLQGEAYADQVVSGEGTKRDWAVAAEWLQRFLARQSKAPTDLSQFAELPLLPPLPPLPEQHPVQGEAAVSLFRSSIDMIASLGVLLLEESREGAFARLEAEIEWSYTSFFLPVWTVWRPLFQREGLNDEALEKQKWIWILKLAHELQSS